MAFLIDSRIPGVAIKYRVLEQALLDIHFEYLNLLSVIQPRCNDDLSS